MKINYILSIAFLLVAFSCTNEFDSHLVTNPDGFIKYINSSSDNYYSETESRLNDILNIWEAGDRIGLFMFASGSNNVLNNASNISFSAVNSGPTVSFSTENPITISPENADYYVYYPFSATAISYSDGVPYYSINLSDQSSGYNDCDLMWAKLKEIPYDEACNLSFQFSHQLCKLVIKPKLEEDDILNSVYLKNIPSKASFNLMNGSISSIETSNVIPYYNKEDGTYSVLLLPTSTVSDIVISFDITSGNVAKEYTYTVNPEMITSFEAGKSYSLSLDIQSIDIPDVGDEDNYDKIIDYTSYTDLLSELVGVSGSCAIRFSSAESNELSNTLEIPSGITELHLISSDDIQARVKMKDIKLVSTLKKLEFNNLRIVGQDGVSLISGDSFMASSGSIEINNSELSDMEYIYYIEGYDKANLQPYQESFIESFTVDNSIIHDVKSVVWIRTVANVLFRRSTVYNVGDEIYMHNTNLSPLGQNMTLTLEDCTIVGHGSNNAFSGDGKNITAYLYRNIILAASSKNVIYRVNVQSVDPTVSTATLSIGTYEQNYVPEGYSNRMHNQYMLEEVIKVVSPSSGLLPYYNFDNPTNDFRTNYNAGDPRWRITAK